LHRLAHAALDLIFPVRCSSCDAPGESPFCAPCADTLVALPPGCPVCSVPGDDPAFRPRRCGHCRDRAPPFAHASAPYLHGRATGQQVGRDRAARERNLRGAFAVCGEVRARRICLLDDVLTTGATASAAAEALLAAGAARVEVRTLARAP